jgi:hypothetical protein
MMMQKRRVTRTARMTGNPTQGAMMRMRIVMRTMGMTMDLTWYVNNGQTISWILGKGANTVSKKSDSYS